MKAKNKQKAACQKGFSLIEMMIVVAILGILATIAVPNYEVAQARARQVEAKSDLSSIYIAETSYFAENGSYTLCLFQAGYAPEASQYFYTTGFINQRSGSVCGGLNSCWLYDPTAGLQCSAVYTPWNGTTRDDATFLANSWSNLSLTGQTLTSGFNVTTTTFNAVAFGSVSGAPIFDVWQIDQQKNLITLQVGY